MFLSRPALATARSAAVSPMIKRSFTSSFVRRTNPPSTNSRPASSANGTSGEAAPTPASGSNEGKIKKFEGTDPIEAQWEL